MTGDPRFHEELKKLGDLHDAKQSDYGRKEDPFANVRASEEWGMPPWVGAMVRANDKMKRLQKAARGGTMTNEAVEDSFQDLAVYAIIGLILYREDIGGAAGVREPRDDGGTPGDQDSVSITTSWEAWEEELRTINLNLCELPEAA